MFHKNIKIGDTVYPLAVNISGHGAPTTSTEGAVDMLYRNKDDNSVYQCIAASGGVYTWVPFDVAGGIPSYWISHIESKVIDIRKAMESAGRNKSAFLWYSDVHWNLNHKQSPKLLKYLHDNTAINKTNFGGDVVQDEPTDDTIDDTIEMSYINEWRKAVRCLPNHHSVVGNHDDGTHNNHFTDGFIYSYLLAPEESNDIVYGENFYYYIDDKSEKTRYIYLDTAYKTGDDAQAQFLINALSSTPSGWHIVAIAHIWHDAMWTEEKGDYLGDYSVVAGKFLKVMYDYNHRASGSIMVTSAACAYDFSGSGGKVEFCIGGHIHWDNVSYYNDEIPVILTETDSTRERVNITAVQGTITENAVNAIIADYNNDKVSVIRIGRGNSFDVSLTDTSITTRHSIVQNLTNVSSSNTISTVEEGGSFKTTLTATSGTMKSVVVTMGGVDVTASVYADGVVNITNVTGMVIITATAETENVEPDEPSSYTNVLLTAEAYDSTALYNGKGYKENVRPSTSTGTGETACSGMSSTGYIPYNGQTTLRMKNMGFKTDCAVPNQCVIQSWSSKTVRDGGAEVADIAVSSEWSPVMNGTIIEQVTLPQWFRANCVYIRICCGYIGSDSIITLDEPIE